MPLLNKCCTQICFTALYFERSFKSMWAGGAIFLLLLLLLCFPSLTIIIFRFFSVKLNAHKLQPFVNCSANKHFGGLVLLSFYWLYFVVVVFFFSRFCSSNQSIEMCMQILLMNGMCTLNCVYVRCLTIDRIPK